MKNINPLIVITLLFLSLSFTSCEVIEGIFEAGMGFGIFLVIAVIVVVIFIIAKMAKK